MTDDVKALVERLNKLSEDWKTAYLNVASSTFAEAAAALTAQAEEIERLQLRLGSLGANPNMDQDIAGLCVRLGAMYSHRSDGIPTQFVNPDGKDAVAAIEKLNAALKAAQEVKV